MTVVIPLFNADQPKARRALESVRNQTHANTEVVLVDDGSTPAQADFLDGLAAGEDRIRVIHQPNGGVSLARNRGLEDAGGEYVCFLDADDWLLPEFLTAALAACQTYDLDAVFGGIRVLSNAGCVQWRSAEGDGTEVLVLSGPEMEGPRGRALSASPRPTEPAELTLATNVVAALFVTQLARSVGFVPGVKHGEDRVFNFDVMGRANRVGFCSSPWYVYDRTGGEGATQRLSGETAEGLAQTMEAFARAGRLSEHSKGAPLPLQLAAARGILNYMKTAALILGPDSARGDAKRRLTTLMALEYVQIAAHMVRGGRPLDRALAWLVRHRASVALLALGRLRATRPGLRHA